MNNKLDDRIKDLEERVKQIKDRVDTRYPSPVLHTVEDIALYEAVFDILSKGDNPIATHSEIVHYLDLYGQAWTAVVHLLIDKGLTTPKEINCEILAFHHFLRMEGYNTNKSKEELFIDRQKYVSELMSLNDPLDMIGR